MLTIIHDQPSGPSLPTEIGPRPLGLICIMMTNACSPSVTIITAVAVAMGTVPESDRPLHDGIHNARAASWMAKPMYAATRTMRCTVSIFILHLSEESERSVGVATPSTDTDFGCTKCAAELTVYVTA